MKAQEEQFITGRNGSRSLGRGTIVNMASLASYVGVYSAVQYSSSKAAALGITRTAGKYYKAHVTRLSSLLMLPPFDNPDRN